MLNLIKIEWIKECKSKRLFISLMVCLAAMIGFGFFLKQDSIGASNDMTDKERQLQDAYEKSTNWKEQMKIQMQLNEYLSDIYSDEEIDVKNQILQYRIDNDVKPYGKNTTWDFIIYSFDVIGLLVAVFSIIFSVEIVVKEYTYKTTKLLFTKPYSRSEIILAKYITCILYTALLTLFCYLAAYIVGGIYFSFEGAGVVTVIKMFHTMFCCTLFEKSIIYLAAIFLNAVVLISIAFLLGIICRTQVLPLIATLGIMLFGNMIAQKIYSAGFKMIRFSILPNLSLSGFIDSSVAKGYSPGLFCITVIVHVIILLAASVQIIKRVDL